MGVSSGNLRLRIELYHRLYFNSIQLIPVRACGKAGYTKSNNDNFASARLGDGFPKASVEDRIMDEVRECVSR